MVPLFSVILFFFLILVFFTHIFSLPANWLILILLFIGSMLNPTYEIPFSTMYFLGAVALAGELVEFGLQMLGAKKFGATNAGNWGAIAGAICGALLGAPILLGLGALVGAVVGAFIGCYFVETMNGRSRAEAIQAAWGAMLGKILGMAVKMGIGVFLLVKSFQLLF